MVTFAAQCRLSCPSVMNRNPHGVPWVSYILIAINSAVYLLISIPLSLTRPDFNDPVLLEYVSVLVDQLPQGLSQAEILERISVYDLVMFNFGFRPADPVPLALVTSLFLHGGFMHLAGKHAVFSGSSATNVEHRLGFRSVSASLSRNRSGCKPSSTPRSILVRGCRLWGRPVPSPVSSASTSSGFRGIVSGCGSCSFRFS